MDDYNEDVELGEDLIENTETAKQGSSFIEEIRELEAKAKEQNYTTFKKSTYWHQQNGFVEEDKREDFYNQLLESLLRIETILIKIETLFNDKKE